MIEHHQGLPVWLRALIPDTRAIVALGLIGAFLYAYFTEPESETMKGALIAAFSAAWGFYLGSSKGAHENRAAAIEDHKTVLAAITKDKANV